MTGRDGCRLSVVICTFNRCHLPTNAVRSLFAEPASPELFEVIVADNGSTDATPDAGDGGSPARAVKES